MRTNLSIGELSAKVSFLKNLVAETERGEHDATLKSPREEVIQELNKFIAEGEELLREAATQASLRN